MKAAVRINGHKIGDLGYELPKDRHAKVVPCPRVGNDPGEVTVYVEGPDGQKWIGVADLVDITDRE